MFPCPKWWSLTHYLRTPSLSVSASWSQHAIVSWPPSISLSGILLVSFRLSCFLLFLSRQNLPVISLCHLSDFPTSHLRCACHISTSQLIDRKQIHILHQTRSLLLLLHSFGFWHWHTQYIGHWTRIETILTGQSNSTQATNWNFGPKDTLIKSSNC